MIILLASCSAAPPLPDFAYSGDLPAIKRLVADGTDIHQRENRYGHTALHKAALAGQLEVAAYLLAEGADVNAKDSYGLTPLHLAAWKGSVDIVKLLIARGANVNDNQNRRRLTPLHIAARRGHSEIVTLLLAAGAREE